MKRLVAGTRAVAEAVRSKPEAISVILVAADKTRPLRSLLDAARERRVDVEERTEAELDGLAGELKHQGVLAITGQYPYASFDALVDGLGERPLLVALDQVTDPRNFGAIVRTAVALGVDGILTLKDRASPVTPVVVRASAGATEHAKIARVTNLARTLDALKERGMSVVGLAGEGSVGVADVPPASDEGRVLVIGSEGRGLRRLVRERCDVLARIEMRGPIESLNASVAAAIAIWEATR